MRRLAAAVAVLALSAPAGALGVFAGTYEGKLRCRENAAGLVAKTRQDLLIELAGGAGIFAVQVFASGQVYAYRIEGPVVEYAGKPDRATLSAVTCDFSPAVNSGVVLHAELTAKEGSDKATLEGTLLRLSGGGTTSELCTFAAKRTSVEVPVVSACPP